MNTGEALSQRILGLCRERNLSVNRLCTISGVTQSTVNNILSGRNASTTVSTIKKLCDGLEITLGEFFSTPEFDHLEQEIR
jgi:transcriptional regulator with XRE-family HTH domain